MKTGSFRAAFHFRAGETSWTKLIGQQLLRQPQTSPLRILKRGDNSASPVPCPKNDTFVEELEEFAGAVRGDGRPEMGGDAATKSLAVIRAGIVSAREGRRVEVAEMLSKD